MTSNNNHVHPPIGIRGLGVCVPDRVLTNADLEKMVDTSDEWIISRTGIRERRIIGDDQVPTDLALVAARNALEDARLTPGDIGAVVYCSFVPDYMVPPSACIVQHKLGIPTCMAFDLNAACTGFVQGLQNAYSLVHSHLASNVLVIGCDCASRMVDWKDRNTCILFGDGAGAVVVGTVEEGRGLLGHDAGSDGSGAELLMKKVGAGAVPATPENVTHRDNFMQMNGREVFKFAVRALQESMERSLARAGLTSSDVDLLVPHQANIRIIQSAMERFGFTEDRVVINIDRYGNTSAASIPLALDTARLEGRLKPGTVCGLVAFGAGLTYASSVVRW